MEALIFSSILDDEYVFVRVDRMCAESIFSWGLRSIDTMMGFKPLSFMIH